jgi:hypothetical protein
MRFLVLLFLVPFFSHAQNLDEYNQERLKLTENLMIGLGSWSVANMGVSGVGWATTNHEAKYFHQMNVMWSGVNLLIAVPSYLRAKNTDRKGISFSETYRIQNRKEKVFLFNTALDLLYVSGGFYLKQRASVDANNYYRFRGWGNSLIMQGGFLFILDLTATLLHTKHRKNKLDGFWTKMDQVSLGMTNNGMGVQFHL